MDDNTRVNVHVVVKGFDGPRPTFRARIYRDFSGEGAMLPHDEGDIGQLQSMEVPNADNPPIGQPVYGVVIGHSWAYPCVSASLSRAKTELELKWWNEDVASGKPIARMMEPTVLEAAPSTVLPYDFLEMARECQAPEQAAGFFAAWPRNTKWRSVRDAFLKDNPRCAGCGGTRMLNVHHKKPFHLFPDLELEPANLIVLCEVPSHACHFVLGHSCDWKAYNPFVEEDARQRLERIALRQY